MNLAHSAFVELHARTVATRHAKQQTATCCQLAQKLTTRTAGSQTIPELNADGSRADGKPRPKPKLPL